MPKFPLPEFTINYKGDVPWKAFLAFLYDWFAHRQFRYYERKHKVRPDERELTIEVERKITGYIRYWMRLEIRFIDVKEVAVSHDKEILNGHFSMDIIGEWEADWQRMWGGSKFLQHLDFFFRKFIIHQDLEHVYEDNLLIMVNNLKRDVQVFLGMEVLH